MFGAVILTLVITVLFMLVLFLWKSYREQADENDACIRENEALKRQIDTHAEYERRRRERRAYDRGLYDGRETDALYRQCLKKYTSREQADVMMKGEDKR